MGLKALTQMKGCFENVSKQENPYLITALGKKVTTMKNRQNGTTEAWNGLCVQKKQRLFNLLLG